jgi:hypothetical protein
MLHNSVMNMTNMPYSKDELDNLIRMLELARDTGYSIHLSPVDALLEAGNDVCLSLATALNEGRVKELKANPAIGFSKSEVDALGNPKQFFFGKQRSQAWNPQLSQFFRKLASVFVKLKTSLNVKDVMSLLAEMVIEITPTDVGVETTTESNAQAGKTKTAKSSTYYYNRRQRKRKVGKHIK